MSGNTEFFLGEFQRTLDDRYRLSIPSELSDPLLGESTHGILAKERRGCLSLWSAPLWEARLQEGVELVKQKMQPASSKSGSAKCNGSAGSFPRGIARCNWPAVVDC